AVLSDQLLAIGLLPAARGWINDAGDPIAPRPDGRGVDTRLGLPPVVLGVEVNDIGREVVRAPDRRRLVPPNVQPVGPPEVRRDYERIADDLALLDRVDRPLPQG